MKLRVNLYQAVLQPKVEKMPLSQVLWMLGSVMLLVVVAGLWNYQQVLQQRQQAALVATQVQSKLTELEVFQTSLASRQPSALLQQQAQQLQQSISQKQQLLGYLKQEISQTPPQYSQVLNHLAAIDLPGIWLTGFQLGQQQQFSGVVKDSQLLPRWLVALGKNPLLQGQNFDGVKLQPLAQAPYLQFEVSAKPDILAPESLLQSPQAVTPQSSAAAVTPDSGGQP